MVDDEEYENLNKFKWFARYNPDVKNYYAVRSSRDINGKQIKIYMHRELLNCPKGLQVDHKNHNTLDNQRGNLSIVTNRQNAQNRRNHSLKLPCVYIHSKTGMYVSKIRIGKKIKNLGRFSNEEEAFIAYCGALKGIGETFYNPLIN